MIIKDMEPVTIARVIDRCNVCHHIGEDFILTDFSDITLPAENRRMGCIFVGLCSQGAARYTVGTTERAIRPGDIVILAEGEVLGNINVADPLSGDVIFISHDFFYDVIRDVRDVTNLFVFAREHPVISLAPHETEVFSEYLNVLRRRVADTTHLFRRQVTGTLIASMIYDLCNITAKITDSPMSAQGKAQEIFEKYIRLVELNFRRERRVSWYSERIGVSSKTLLEMVKRASRRTPNEWLDIYTSLEIRLLLRNTTKTIKEIASDLHFSNQSSLGKFFREHVGMSPKEYRKG